MTREFPNRSRSFDEARNAVSFIGHDGIFEMPFFAEFEAPARRSGAEPMEADCLAASDAARGSIHDVTREAYSHGRRTAYMVTATNFR